MIQLPKQLNYYAPVGQLRGRHYRSDLFEHKGHIIKSTGEANATNEDLASRIFQATRTPGAIATRHVVHPVTGEHFSVSRIVPNAKPLGDSKAPVDPVQAANILLTEHLAGIDDRHSYNYLVSPQGVHSIDHEARFLSSVYPENSGLYNHVATAGNLDKLVASPEHLQNWYRVLTHPTFQRHRFAGKMIERYKNLPVNPDGSINIPNIRDPKV